MMREKLEFKEEGIWVYPVYLHVIKCVLRL